VNRTIHKRKGVDFPYGRQRPLITIVQAYSDGLEMRLSHDELRSLRTTDLPMSSARVQMMLIHWHWRVFLVWTVVASGLTTCACEAADDAPATTTKAAEAPALRPITLTDIAVQAVEVAGSLRTLNTSIDFGARAHAIETMLSEVRRRNDADLAGLGDTDKDTRHITILQAQEQRWQRREKRLAGWLAVLTGETKRLQETLNRLTDLEQSWQLTATAARDSHAPQEILDQIDQTIAAISAARASVEPKRTSMFELQLKVAHEESRCGEVLATMANAETLALGGVLWRENPSLWNADLWRQSRSAMPQHARRVVSAFRDDIHDYVHDPTAGMLGHVVLLAVLTALFVTTRHRVRRWTAAQTEVPASTMVFDRPFAAAVAGTMLVATSPMSSMPTELKGVFQVVAVAAMIRVTLPLIPRSLAGALYGLGCLFTVDTVRQSFIGTALTEQIMLVGESLGGIVLVIWLRRANHLGCLTWRERKIVDVPVCRFLVAGVAMLLTVATLAGIFGYLHLARLITPGLLALSTLAFGFYATYKLASGVVGVLLRVRPIALLRMVQRHRELLERRVCRLLGWLAAMAWLARSLEYLGFLKPLLAGGSALLSARLERGSVEVSVEGILAFVLAILLAYLTSRFIRFALDEDVHSRMQTAPGLSYALSTLVHYALLSLGFLLGLGFLGVDLTKVTVLVSAFGVGIGFGLQSIVNNFASGLILLVERPISAHDAVEIGGLSGTVQHIGIRATIVRTGDGADTIVPNSQFVSEKVVNWTLTDRRRRIRLTVGLDYDSPPEEVIRMLVSVASAHSGVLRNPPPRALLVKYGDSALEYELRVWTDQFDQSTQIQSELAAAVYAAAQAEGMSFPFPQREVRLLQDDGSADHRPIRPTPEASDAAGPAEGACDSVPHC
jgi:potassium-dependent mechanosensitive channel